MVHAHPEKVEVIDMLFTGFISLILDLANWLTEDLAELSFKVSDGFYEVLNNFLGFAVWLIPWRELAPIVVFIVAMMAFRVTVSIVKTIWNLLPIV